MDYASIVSVIQSLGFPIACVIAMFYFWNKEREDHKTEMQEITAALNNNTIALTKLTAYIDREGGENNVAR